MPHFLPRNVIRSVSSESNPEIFYLWVAFVKSGDAGDDSLTLEWKRTVCVNERLHLGQRLQHEQALRPSSQASVPHLLHIRTIASISSAHLVTKVGKRLVHLVNLWRS